jgi:hypothetical protein
MMAGWFCVKKIFTFPHKDLFRTISVGTLVLRHAFKEIEYAIIQIDPTRFRRKFILRLPDIFERIKFVVGLEILSDG